MRPPRLKLRTLIVLVALAALAVGLVAYERRSARYWALAAREGDAEKAARSGAAADRRHLDQMLEGAKERASDIRRTLDDVRQKLKQTQSESARTSLKDFERELIEGIAMWEREQREEPDRIGEIIEEDVRRADYHAQRRHAYLRCARYPWLSPPADDRDEK